MQCVLSKCHQGGSNCQFSDADGRNPTDSRKAFHLFRAPIQQTVSEVVYVAGDHSDVLW